MGKKGLLLLVLSCMFFTGCSSSSQVEDQAYIIVMGLDRMKTGEIKMTVQIPQIAGGDSTGGAAAGNYKHFSVQAMDYESALEKLTWAATRDPNLAQMKLIVVSSKLAQEENFATLIENIAQTEQLYTATKVAVCEGEAGKFVEAIRPNIGTRISSDIDALFEYYSGNGFVPDSSLADLYYLTESFYSDPMVAYALLDESEKPKQDETSVAPASVLGGSVKQLSEDYKSENQTRYLGAAVFSSGCMVGVLNVQQTIMANLLRNEVESFQYEFQGQSLRLVPTRAVRVKVKTKEDAVKIQVGVKLSISSQEEKPDEDALRNSLKVDILDAFNHARSIGAEPFGFAEKAALHFMTIDDWKKFDWKKQLQQAEIEIDIQFAYSDT